MARNLANEGYDVTLVSKDLPLRIKASAVGLDAEEYRGEQVHESDAGWTGMTEVDVAARRPRRAVRRPGASTSTRPASCPATPAWC